MPFPTSRRQAGDPRPPAAVEIFFPTPAEDDPWKPHHAPPRWRSRPRRPWTEGPPAAGVLVSGHRFPTETDRSPQGALLKRNVHAHRGPRGPIRPTRRALPRRVANPAAGFRAWSSSARTASSPVYFRICSRITSIGQDGGKRARAGSQQHQGHSGHRNDVSRPDEAWANQHLAVAGLIVAGEQLPVTLPTVRSP